MKRSAAHARTRSAAVARRRSAAFARGVWEFVVGDDWRIAVGVAAALGVTAIAADFTGAVWWILPLAAVALLGTSVWRAAHPRR